MTRTFIEILVMLVAANGAPVLAARCLGSRAEWPVDGGRKRSDGQPLYGSSKTWRGLGAIRVASVILAVALDYGVSFGLVFGATVIAGDLLSSFVKRRRGMPSSSRATGLDQLPESPLLWAAAFMVLEIVLSRPLYHLHIRKRPY